MSGLRSSIAIGGYGNIRAAKYDYTFTPSHPLAGGYGAILMHQSGTLYTGQFAQSTTPVSSEIGPALARIGIPSIAGEMNGSIGGDGFHNASTIADMVAAAARVDTLNPTMNTAKKHLVGVSMGLGACLAYAQQNPTKVASVTGIVGLADPMHTYDDVPAQQVAMRTAWAAADRTALAASGYNTLGGMAALNGVVPVQMFYSTADTTVLPITQTTVGALLGATLIPISASLNHTDAEQIMGLIRDRGAGNWASLTDFMFAHDAV